MNIWPLLGILAIIYSAVVFILAVKKPPKIWEMGKVKFFRNLLGEKGTVIFFFIWGILFIILGIWLLTLG